jgi:outer membrane protein
MNRPLRAGALTLLLGSLTLGAAQTQPELPATLAQVQPAPPAPVPPASAPVAPVPTTPPPTTAAPVTLTLPQLLAALTQAPGWRSAALQALSARQALDTARARAGLSLSVGADVTALKVPVDGSWSSTTSLTVQAGLGVLPWSPAQDGVRQATRALERAGLDQRDAQASLALSVVQGYQAARQASASLTLARAQQALAERQLAVAQAQRQADLISQEGLLDRQAALEQTAQASGDALAALDSALRQLSATLGTPLPGPETARLGTILAQPGAPAPLEGLLARAQTGRSEVLRARSAQQDAQAALEIAQRDRRLPNLSAGLQYGQLAGGSSVAGNTVGSSLNFKTGVLGLSASLPLNQSGAPSGLALNFSGSVALLDPVADAAVRSAQTAVQSAALALDSARSGVELDVRQRYAALQGALAALNPARTSLTRAQTALASAQARLAAGLDTPLTVQTAELALAQAQTTLERLGDAAALASLQLSAASGSFSLSLLSVTDTPTPTPAPGGQP